MNWISFRPIVTLFNLGLNTISNEANMLKTYLAVKCITKMGHICLISPVCPRRRYKMRFSLKS